MCDCQTSAHTSLPPNFWGFLSLFQFLWAHQTKEGYRFWVSYKYHFAGFWRLMTSNIQQHEESSIAGFNRWSLVFLLRPDASPSCMSCQASSLSVSKSCSLWRQAVTVRLCSFQPDHRPHCAIVSERQLSCLLWRFPMVHPITGPLQSTALQVKGILNGIMQHAPMALRI